MASNEICVNAGCFHARIWHHGRLGGCRAIGCDCQRFSSTRETMPSDKLARSQEFLLSRIDLANFIIKAALRSYRGATTMPQPNVLERMMVDWLGEPDVSECILLREYGRCPIAADPPFLHVYDTNNRYDIGDRGTLIGCACGTVKGFENGR